MKQKLLILLLLTTQYCLAQQPNVPKNSPGPWALHFTFEPIIGETAPGLHSFAYATYGSKWLFIGGRTNGMHGQNSNSNFETEFANNRVVVIDTIDWQWASASLTQLPQAMADPLSSTNMQYWANDTMLYMIGGYGWDSIAEGFVTYPSLSAINIQGIINAVETGDSLRPHIRQYTDTNLAVCGGELIQMDSLYYLIMGHKFEGRYSTPAQMQFTQRYTNAIRHFSIVDDGTTLSISNFAEDVDTNNFHRRDLNAVRLDFADSSRIAVMGGVFQKNADLPFYSPVLYSSQSSIIDTASYFYQKFNQYTSAHLIIQEYPDEEYSQYGIFTFGGMGTYYFNDTTQSVVYDSLVPFSKTISLYKLSKQGPIQTESYEGSAEQSFGLMPGFLGTNAKYIRAGNLTPRANGAILLTDLPNDYSLPRKFIGYLFGGIRGTKANFGVSSANDTIYRVYVDCYDFEGAVKELPGISIKNIYPNPGNGIAMLALTLDKPQKVKATLCSINGAEVQPIYNGNLSNGPQNIPVNAGNLPAGLYLVKIETPGGIGFLKYVVVK